MPDLKLLLPRFGGGVAVIRDGGGMAAMVVRQTPSVVV
jgi:hypothetical protein